MAKKIRGVKLKDSDINKNSGKKIVNTIAKIKENEKKYTIILVIVFMVVISFSVFAGIKVGTYSVSNSRYNNTPGVSSSSSLISLNNDSIMSDEDGLTLDGYNVKINNTTTSPINYLVRVVNDELSIANCNCGDKIISYDKIKFAIDGKIYTFKDEEMVVTSGLLKNNSKETINIKMWLDESLDKNSEHFFYGRFNLEQLENMDEDN